MQFILSPTSMKKPSTVLTKLRAGQIVSCCKLNLADPRAAEIAAFSGFDCVWLDMEHVPNSIRDIENQVRACKVYGTDVIVRVKRGAYSDLVQALEADATGIMVPHVLDLDDAKQIVRHTRFHPIGRRPLDGGNADNAYGAHPCDEYIRFANHQRMVIVQIEDPEAMDHLDSIAALEGIDMLFFGPGDYSHALGVPGELDHPLVCDARRRVVEAAHRYGKFAGTTGTNTTLPGILKLGYQFVNVAADVASLREDFTRIAAEFRLIAADAGTTRDTNRAKSAAGYPVANGRADR